MDHYCPDPSRVDFAKRRIALLVDDDNFYREIMSEVLLESGWEVLSTSTGEDALMVYTDAIPEVVVINVNLDEGMDGWTFSQLARSQWPNIGLVFISAIHQLPQRYYDVFTKRILLKPFFLSDFLAAVAEMVPTVGAEAHQRTTPS